MTQNRWPLAALLGALLMAPGAAATTVDVPDMVLFPKVPFLVSGATVGSNVTMTVATIAAHGTTTTTQDTFTVNAVPSGWQVWTVAVDKGASHETFSGTIYVDSSLGDLVDAVTDLQVAVQDARDDLAASNTTSSDANAELLAQLESINATARQTLVALLTATTGGAQLPVNVTEALRRAATEVLRDEAAVPGASVSGQVKDLQATTDQASLAAAQASQWATYAALAAGAAALLMIAVGLFLFQQLQKSRQEFLVYVLALAAHSGITPESPEFKHALEATGHVPKAKKAKAEKAPKAEKPKGEKKGFFKKKDKGAKPKDKS